MQAHSSFFVKHRGPAFLALVLAFILLFFIFAPAVKGEDTVYSLCLVSSQGYIIAAQAKNQEGDVFTIQVQLLQLSAQTANPPISFSIYDEGGYLASAVPALANYYTAPSEFIAQVNIESSIESLYLVPVLRQGGEDSANQTPCFHQGELAQVNLSSSSSKLNLRNSPHSESSVLSSFSTGTPVLITGRPKENWAQVTVNKGSDVFTGYMNSEYLTSITFNQNTDTPEDTPQPQDEGQPLPEQGFVTPLPNASQPPNQGYEFQPPIQQPQPTPAPAYQRAYQANQHMSAGYTVNVTALEQADRPNWFTFNLSLAYDNPGTSTGNISLFYLYLNDEFFGVLMPYQTAGSTGAGAGSTYVLSALINDTIQSLALIPVYDGWAKGAEVIPLYAIQTNALMPSGSSSGQSQFQTPSVFAPEALPDANTQTQPMEAVPGNGSSPTGGRTYTALQTMTEGYTLYATAIEEARMNGNFTVHAFLSFDPKEAAPEFSSIHLYVNNTFWAVLSPYEDPWSQQWQQTAPNTFEVKIQIKTEIQTLSLLPVYASGQTSPEPVALTQDP